MAIPFSIEHVEFGSVSISWLPLVRITLDHRTGPKPALAINPAIVKTLTPNIHLGTI